MKSKYVTVLGRKLWFQKSANVYVWENRSEPVLRLKIETRYEGTAWGGWARAWKLKGCNSSVVIHAQYGKTPELSAKRLESALRHWGIGTLFEKAPVAGKTRKR